jgi:IS30 family transposase
MRKYQRLTIDEREQIVSFLSQGKSLRQIALCLNRNVSTISREVGHFRKNGTAYKAWLAQECSDYLSTKRNVGLRIANNAKLHSFIVEKLKLRWSPVQISTELRSRYPNNKHMQASHETIYTYLYMLPKGELKKELIGYLRQKKKLRKNRKLSNDSRGKIPDMISIHERPKEVEDRIIPGHWEGDLIMGKDHKSALGTMVERTTRTVILVPLKTKDAKSVRKTFAKELKTLPSQMKRSMTYDRGKEMAEHKLFTKQTKMQVYFCDPHSPWQRGTNENTNMLIRDFFPKQTDFSKFTRKEIKYIQKLLNERPRKTLDFKTPKEKFKELLLH